MSHASLYGYRALHLAPVGRERPDADSMRVRVDLGMRIFHETAFRLARINAFELSEPLGYEARDFMWTLWPHGTILNCETFKDPTDKYGRWIAEVWLPDGRNLSDSLVDAKYAVYRDYNGPHPDHIHT